MTKYCTKCGEQLDNENASFCGKCGARLEKNNTPTDDKNRTIIAVLAIIVVMLIVGAVYFSGGFGLFGEPTSILIISESPISNSANFTVELMSGITGISGKEIQITFKNSKNTYEFSATTDNDGIANIIPNVEDGEYVVEVKFKGDDKYSQSSASDKFNVETKITEINSQVTSTRTEPDYASFYQARSFDDTDTDGDGYVYLSDMYIAHTPQNIVKQMFAESDNDKDGRLNYNEYYKFMYKLNYDRSSYGL